MSGRLNGARLRAAILLAAVAVSVGTALAAEEPAEAPKDICLPPVFFLSNECRRRLPELVKEDPEARRAFQPLREKADEALKIPPSPLGKVVYEGLMESDPERVRTMRSLEDMERLYALAFAYRVTREDAYRKQAHAYLIAWVRTVKPDGNPINDSKLEALILARDVVGWPGPPQEEDVCRFLGRLARAEEQQARDDEKGAWRARRLKLIGTAGVLLGDQRWVNMAVKGYQQYVADNLRADGGSYDLEQHDALNGHVSGVVPLLELALTLRRKDLNLYAFAAPSGASLKRSVEFVLPYARGQKVHPEWTNSKVAFDRQRWESGDAFYKPGKPWDPAESADLFSLSAFFVKEHAALAAKLRGAKETDRFPDWLSVLRAADK